MNVCQIATELLNPLECFILLSAIQIHDAGHIIGGRENHEQNAKEFLKNYDGCIVGSPEKKIIYEIARAHSGKDDPIFTKVSPFRQIAKSPNGMFPAKRRHNKYSDCRLGITGTAVCIKYRCAWPAYQCFPVSLGYSSSSKVAVSQTLSSTTMVRSASVTPSSQPVKV